MRSKGRITFLIVLPVLIVALGFVYWIEISSGDNRNPVSIFNHLLHDTKKQTARCPRPCPGHGLGISCDSSTKDSVTAEISLLSVTNPVRLPTEPDTGPIAAVKVTKIIKYLRDECAQYPALKEGDTAKVSVILYPFKKPLPVTEMSGVIYDLLLASVGQTMQISMLCQGSGYCYNGAIR